VQVATGSQTRQLQAVATEHGIAMIDLHGDATFQQNLSDSGALGLQLDARLAHHAAGGTFRSLRPLERCAERRGRL
jgi:hypothetical protein